MKGNLTRKFRVGAVFRADLPRYATKQQYLPCSFTSLILHGASLPSKHVFLQWPQRNSKLSSEMQEEPSDSHMLEAADLWWDMVVVIKKILCLIYEYLPVAIPYFFYSWLRFAILSDNLCHHFWFLHKIYCFLNITNCLDFILDKVRSQNKGTIHLIQAAKTFLHKVILKLKWKHCSLH